MKIIQFDPRNQHYQRLFRNLPFDLYKEDPNWVPPLRRDEKQIFKTENHGFYHRGEAAFFLALENEQPTGRLIVLNNKAYNTHNHTSVAHFFKFESQENPVIAHRLFEQAAKWAESQGLTAIYGPKGMTPLDGLGMLVRGFEHRPAFGMPYNPNYYPAYLEACGFNQTSEMVSGYLNPDLAFPQKVERVAELVKKKRGFQVMKMDSRKQLKQAVQVLGAMYNAALTGTEGNVPLNDQDLATMVKGLLWIAKPELVKLIFKEKKPVGFLLAYPDISGAIQETGGRLLPFGWIKLLREKNRTTWININGAGIAEEYRGLGATALLFAELYQSVTESGQFDHAEVVQISTENERMLLELRGLGIEFYKSHGMFHKTIHPH